VTKRRLDTIATIVACVAIASWILGFSLQGKPNHQLLTALAGVGFFGAIIAFLIAIWWYGLSEINRRERAKVQPEDDKRSD
jgi:amino acid transporter